MKKVINKDSAKKRILPLIGAILVFVLCFAELYSGENVGVSDNGDFRRVLIVNNLEYKDDTDHYYLFKQDYKMKIEGDTLSQKLASLWDTYNADDIYWSPQFTIIKASKTINYFVNIITNRPETNYNIMWLALIYILMLSIAAWGIFTFFSDSTLKVRIAVFLIFVIMFCDIGYILYFNSFYGEPLQYVALMMLISVGLLMHRRPSIPKVICFFVALYFFAGSKLANIPYSVIVCILSLTFIVLKRSILFRIGVVVSLLVTVGCVINLSARIPDWMNKDTTYQSVFYGAIKESDTPEKDLKFFGVDKKYAVLMNTNAYMDKDEYAIDILSDEFDRDFYQKVSKLKIAFFYVLHPVRLVKNISYAIENSAYIRPPNSGNSKTVPMELSNRYSLWSHLRVLLKFLYTPLVVFIAFILITAYTVVIDVFYLKRRKKEPNSMIYMMSSFNVLVIGLWINMVLPIIGNGHADIAKHMFLFVNCIDILFAVGIITIIRMKKHNILLSVAGIVALSIVCNYQPPKRTMTFGRYLGEPVTWEIYESLNDGTEILVTKDCISFGTFDGDNNLWEYSDLRNWLNTEFLSEFTPDEVSKIKKTTNQAIVPTEFKSLAVAGDHTNYWNFTKKSSGDLSKTAYHYYVDDYVYIPTLDMLRNIGGKNNYWVLCPYGNNTNMERFVDDYGFVLHTVVTNNKGIRAVIRYNASTDNITNND